MIPWLAGLGVGVAVLIAAQSVPWGLAAGLAAFFLVRWRHPRPSALPADIETSHPQRERATSIEVVCKTVTPARQEWVSLKTGRLFDVLSANGPPGARPGDKGRVTLTGTTWRIDPLTPRGQTSDSNREEVKNARG